MPETKILLANANNVQTQMISACLEIAGYHVFVASRGREALEMIQSRRPDLAIIEKKLPDLNGLAVIRFIRLQTSYQELPVILTGVDKREDEIISGLEAGADVCLETPFHQGILIARVHSLLRYHRC